MIEAELLTCQDVMRLTSIRSRTTVWRRVRKGDFPSPIDIGNGRIRWRTSSRCLLEFTHFTTGGCGIAGQNDGA